MPQLQTGSRALDEETSKHIIGVLRMKAGESLMLTDGKGVKAHAVIEDDHRKKCVVAIEVLEQEAPYGQEVVVAISPVKNNARFEWFLEKATEVGVQRIIPLICERTIREKFRFERMHNILVSAMLQSQQSFLPVLAQPMQFSEIGAMDNMQNKFIAHCLPQQKDQLQQFVLKQTNIILIGPEGDFTEQEIVIAMENGFRPVSLGATRLRTETAGLAAAVLLCSKRT